VATKTYTVIRRGEAIRDSEGRITGFKKGKRTQVTVDDTKRTRITATGSVSRKVRETRTSS
jgi:hypothetical protein